MLSTLIYRSRVATPLQANDLSRLMQNAQERNAAASITGILLFDGVHFVQLLEGPHDAVDALFEVIKRDPRHINVVHLLRDDAPDRRFDGDAMALIDLRDASEEPRKAILAKMKVRAHLASSDDRVIKILLMYVNARGIAHIVEGDPASEWTFAPVAYPSHRDGEEPAHGNHYQFALQPIVDPMRRNITSFEFLIRGPSGGSPEQLFSSLPTELLYQTDLESKARAFQLAHRLGQQHIKISVNLFPMSLIAIPNAVDLLVDQILASGLSPSQVFVEVTEQEAISCLGSFRGAIKQLRIAGIGVAIDDFGAGYAGLSLLAEFQPDKLKIDRKIIQDIHTDGPRQAIVLAIIQACKAMGIMPVAEGVESVEEWCWLQAAGVERFQGYLFARPALNRVPDIWWPKRR